MDKKNMAILAERYLRGVATDEEKTLLHQWYDTWEDDEQVVLTEIPLQEEELKQQLLSRLKKSIETETSSPVKKIPARKYWIAAASILLICTLTIYLLYNGKRSQPVVTVQTTPVLRDAVPGSDKAVLTLADGSTILLDSAKNGSVALQGSSQVLKQKDGQLVYQTNSPGAAPEKILYNTITTPRGGQYQLVLSDGTKVWMNAGSSLVYPTVFSGTERKVQLTGEAYFEVMPITVADHKKMPFIVGVKEMSVKVLGTEFNINAYDDEEAIKTTLLGGSVDITGSQNNSMQLSPNEQSVYNRDGSIKLVKDADTGQAIAWKNGLFKFISSDLASIMRQISRWYDVEISYSGDVKDETFSGDFPRRQNASEVFKVLEMTKTVQFSIENKKVMIEPYKK